LTEIEEPSLCVWLYIRANRLHIEEKYKEAVELFGKALQPPLSTSLCMQHI